MYEAYLSEFQVPAATDMDSCENCGKDTKAPGQNEGNRKDTVAEDGAKCDEVESGVPQEIIEKWEKEQDELKKKQVFEDADIIKEMVAVGDEADRDYYIGGVDISFIKGDDVHACAALVVINYPQLELVYEDYQMIELTAPYIPGFLAFREAEFLVQLFDTLKQTQPQFLPQVVMVDGNGILHPRHFGIGCHLGVLLDIPCLGVAKNLHQVDGLKRDEAHMEKIKALSKGGDTFPLYGETGTLLGKALRSCDKSTNPIYVSVGHRVSLDSAVQLVCRCCKYRIPEPTRLADINSREFLRVNFKPSEDHEQSQNDKKEAVAEDVP